MSQIDITFVNTINNAEASAAVPMAITREQILQTLIANGFIQPPQQGQSYKVTVKGRREMLEAETLADVGAQNLDRILLAVYMSGGGVPPEVRRAVMGGNQALLAKVQATGCLAITWEQPPGTLDRYLVTYRIRSYILNGTKLEMNSIWKCQIIIPPNFPEPKCFQYEHVRFLDKIPYNPHVFPDGRVCLGGFASHETLWVLFRKIAMMLQLKPEIINLNDPANGVARDALQQKTLNWNIDTTILPDEQGAWAGGSFTLNFKT